VHIHFKSKVVLGKKIYGPGNVDLDVAGLAPHEQKYVHALIQANHAIAVKDKPIDPTPEQDKSKELAERFLAEAAKKKPRGPIKDTQSLPDGVEPGSQASDQSSEEDVESDESEAGEDEGEESDPEAEDAPAGQPRSHHKKKKSRR
jgi:hypothetical protein